MGDPCITSGKLNPTCFAAGCGLAEDSVGVTASHYTIAGGSPNVITVFALVQIVFMKKSLLVEIYT